MENLTVPLEQALYINSRRNVNVLTLTAEFGSFECNSPKT